MRSERRKRTAFTDLVDLVAVLALAAVVYVTRRKPAPSGVTRPTFSWGDGASVLAYDPTEDQWTFVLAMRDVVRTPGVELDELDRAARVFGARRFDDDETIRYESAGAVPHTIQRWFEKHIGPLRESDVVAALTRNGSGY